MALAQRHRVDREETLVLDDGLELRAAGARLPDGLELARRDVDRYVIEARVDGTCALIAELRNGTDRPLAELTPERAHEVRLHLLACDHHVHDRRELGPPSSGRPAWARLRFPGSKGATQVRTSVARETLLGTLAVIAPALTVLIVAVGLSAFFEAILAIALTALGCWSMFDMLVGDEKNLGHLWGARRDGVWLLPDVLLIVQGGRPRWAFARDDLRAIDAMRGKPHLRVERGSGAEQTIDLGFMPRTRRGQLQRAIQKWLRR
jgi:hypothetical protein